MSILMRGLLALAIAGPIAAVGGTAAQGTPGYLDDRSTPAALIQSLYNAIERHEYARAWSYFAEPPAATFEAYEAGFADTHSVAIEIGAVTAEGAAGSIYYEVPVILRATDANQTRTVFSGCYVVREINATIQTPPFRPLLIQSGTFKAQTEETAAFPPDCGGGAADPGIAAAAEVTRIFAASHGDSCNSLWPAFNPEGVTPEIYAFEARYDWEGAEAPVHTFRLFRFWCMRGAYNVWDVYYLQDEIEGIRLLSFAFPDVAVTYQDADQTRLGAISVIGFVARDQVPLSTFDPADLSITGYVKWRGLGDASENGRWVFQNGEFRLEHFEVDPTFDGEINPVVIVENGWPVE